MQRPWTRTSLRALALASLGLVAQAQIVLPSTPVTKPAPQEGEQPKPDPKQGTGSKGGLEDGELPDSTRRAVRDARGKRGLELPDERTKLEPKPAARPVTEAAPVPLMPVVPAASGAAGTGASAADFVLAEVAKTRDVASSLVEQASQSLLRMGEEGRVAAGRALQSDHAPTLMAAARTLLRSAVSSDGLLVVERLKSRLPNAACTALVDALCELDPVRASPTLLAELLAHKQTAVRTAASRHLVRMGRLVTLESLATPLASKDSDARLRAVQLVASSQERGSTTILLQHLDDPNAGVARRALEALATRDEAGLDLALVQKALGERWILRSGAFALLAICEREDQRLSSVLGASHVPRLLEGLSSRDPFIAGSCASALAGIGFRGEEALETPWLDVDVPHRLVRVAGAEDFSPDFSALVPTAVRRLGLLTGQNFGTDGPRWIEWWTANAKEFRAARAVLQVAVEDAPTVDLRVESELGEVASWRLVGRARAEALASAGGLPADTFVLSDTQARGLFLVLQDNGLFGAGCMPGNRGSSFDAGRSLSVECRGQSKSFRFAGAKAEAWFDKVLDAASALRSRNRWQAHADPALALSRHEFWKAEAPWWDEVSDPQRRARRLRELAFARLVHLPVDQRDAGVAELERLAREGLEPVASDLDDVLGLLAQERFPGERARKLVGLALGLAAPANAPLPAPVAQRLVDTWIESFGNGGPEMLVTLLGRAGPAFAIQCASDARPFVRAISAAALVREPGQAELETLRRLADDVEPRVQASALLALGEAKVVATRELVAERAKAGPIEVRAAALRAIGRLGGERALSLLLDALGGTEPALRSAAAEGLASLDSEGTIPLLVSVVAKGAEDPAYRAAREGLQRKGEGAWDELLRVLRSPAAKSRREAALLLSEQLCPQVTSSLIAMVADAPEDARLAEELAVMSCIDHRGSPNPSGAWWAWWEEVVHDDAQAWLLGATAKLNLAPVSIEALREGRSEALEQLATLAKGERDWLAERARREFSRLAGRDVGALPARGRERNAWLSTLVEQLLARRKE